ncbi:unnamed protein product [Moneuplotes crassus]|uniref:Uncharacterized protein n=1 Tax=Euplotes crassus TaxID=5936 RepID=A0AAD1Y5Z5_EUPCR|nr:unnamed protein product [Moneuplotes crassus]
MEEGQEKDNLQSFIVKEHISAQSADFIPKSSVLETPQQVYSEGNHCVVHFPREDEYESKDGKIMRYSNFASGRTDTNENLGAPSNEWDGSQASPTNRHVSALEKFNDSEEAASLISYQPSPREDLQGSRTLTPNKSPEEESNYGISMIYTTMKVNQTPIDEKGNRVSVDFPPVDMIEDMEHPEENLQTFDLVTYDKEHPSMSSFKNNAIQCENCTGVCNCQNTKVVSNFNPINEILQLTANQVEPDPQDICGESPIMTTENNEIYLKEMEDLNQQDSQTSIKLIKKQNDIIRNLKKEVDMLRNSNKSMASLREENLQFLERIQALETQINTKNPEMTDQAVQMDFDKDNFKQRKEILDFIIKNQGRAVQLTPILCEILLKMITQNDTPDHPELIFMVESINNDHRKYSTHDPNAKLSDSIIEFSTSVQETYSSNRTFEKLQQIHTFGKPHQHNPKSNSRSKISDSNEKPVESENSSKYSFSDKENQIDVRSIVPKFTKRDLNNQAPLKNRETVISGTPGLNVKEKSYSGQTNSNSRNRNLPQASTLRYDINRGKIVLRKSKKSKNKVKKSRNNPALNNAKTTLEDRLCGSKISSVHSLLKDKNENQYSISSSHETQLFGDASKGGKLKVIKKFPKSGKLENGSFVRKSHDGIPTISVTQVKKPLCGGKTRAMNEYRSCKKYNFCAKRGSLNYLHSKSNKNSHRDLLCTPSLVMKENSTSKINNAALPKKKGYNTQSERFIQGVPKKATEYVFSKRFTNFPTKVEAKSTFKIKLPNSTKGSQSRNSVRYLTAANSAASLSKSNSIKRFHPIPSCSKTKKVKNKDARVGSNGRK